MRIVVDLQACQSGSRLGGIGRYSMDLLKAMAASIGKHELYVVLSRLLPLAELEIRVELAAHVEPENILAFSTLNNVTGYDPANRGRRLIGEQLRQDFINKLNPDIVHVASFVEGWAEDVVVSIGNDKQSQKTAITWYDLIPFVKPEMYLTDARLAEYYYNKIAEAKKARLLLAISQYTCDEAIDLLGLSNDQVVNISSGVSQEFTQYPVTQQNRNYLQARFGIDRPFLLFTGSFDARKNQSGLIQAFSKLPSAVRDRYQLVIVGNGWDGVYAKLSEIGRAAGLPTQNLIFTGRVSDEELLLLYNATHLFVFPTMREGFGLPVLEAMACGAPVIGSNCTSVPEVLGREDSQFDPTDTHSISQKIFEVLTDEKFRQSLIKHGSIHHKQFTWEASAKRVLDAFESRFQAQPTKEKKTYSKKVYSTLVKSIAEVVVKSTLAESDIAHIAESIAHNEVLSSDGLGLRQPRVGWVTPWAKRCGVASYSKYLVDAAPFPQTVIFAEKNCSTSDNARDCLPKVIGCWESGEQDDLNELSSRVDENDLDAIIIQCHFGFYNFQSLREFVFRQIGNGLRVFIMLHSTTDPPPNILPKSLSQIQDALQLCERVFVHTHNDADRLKKIGVNQNVSPLPHGLPSNPKVYQPHIRNSSEVVIATYGFFLKHKGLKELVEAFAQLAKDDLAITLRMVNAEYPHPSSRQLIESIQAQILANGICNRVEMITDYLEDAESLQLLSSADLIVFPYQDTTEPSSASVRMGIASGRLVAVTPHSIFDDVDGAVLKLPGSSPNQMAIGLKDFVNRIRSNKADAEMMRVSRFSKHLREERSWNRISDQLLKIVQHACGVAFKKAA